MLNISQIAQWLSQQKATDIEETGNNHYKKRFFLKEMAYLVIIIFLVGQYILCKVHYRMQVFIIYSFYSEGMRIKSALHTFL